MGGLRVLIERGELGSVGEGVYHVAIHWTTTSKIPFVSFWPFRYFQFIPLQVVTYA